ncbi:MAG: TolC family protein [Bacteroidales bacterium]|nr:TolC family protein [Bacteroidales bacterium]
MTRWYKWSRVGVGVTSSATVLMGLGCHSLWDRPEPRVPRMLTRNETIAALQPDGTQESLGWTPVAAVSPVSPAEERVAKPFASPILGMATIGEAPMEVMGNAHTLDLGIALQLAGVDNPTVNLARERVREAVALQLAARSLLLPTLIAGGNVRLHVGPLQDEPGNFWNNNVQSFYTGLGSGVVGTNPPSIPGVRLFAHLGDAVYEPLAARQQVAVRSYGSWAIQNQILLNVAVAYLNLIAAEAQLEIYRQSESEVAEIAKITADFAATGQGTPADANRVATNTDLVQRQISEAEGMVAVASARLCQLLNLDPSLQLHTPGGPVESIRLVSENADTESFVQTAIRSRPELMARVAGVREAQTRVRQEKYRPLFPVISAGYSSGGFGTGGNLVNESLGRLTPRSDFDVYAVWTLQNFGFGNLARTRKANATVGQALADYDVMLNQVRQEVISAQAETRAAHQQVAMAQIALTASEEGYKLERERIRLGQGRPIEVLDSFRQLLDSRTELVRAIIAFNTAQFRLFVAIGNTPIDGSGGNVPADPPMELPEHQVPVAVDSASPGSGVGASSNLLGMRRE